MSYRKALLLLLAVMVAAMCAPLVPARADVTASVFTTSGAWIVDGKTDYHPDDAAKNPRLEGVNVSFSDNPPARTGSVTIDLKSGVTVNYNTRFNDRPPYTEDLSAGEHTFQLIADQNDSSDWTGYSIGDDEGYIASFTGDGADAAFSEADYEILFDGASPLPGRFGKVATFADQFETKKVAPYVELLSDDGLETVSGARVRFVDTENPDTALRRGDPGTEYADINEFSLVSLEGGIILQDHLEDFAPNSGDLLEREVPFDSPVPFEDIWRITLHLLSFVATDGEVFYSYNSSYNWNFYVNEEVFGGSTPTQVAVQYDSHAWTEDGKTVFYPDEDAKKPRFHDTYLYVWDEDLSKTGNIEINLNSDVTVSYYDDDGDDSIADEYLYDVDLKKGPNTFFLWPKNYSPFPNYYLGDKDGNQFDFTSERSVREGLVSESDFTLRFDGEPEIAGKFGRVRTFDEQFNEYKCVPYVELVTEGGKLTGALVRFVDPANPDVALVRNDDAGHDIRLLSQVIVRLMDGDADIFQSLGNDGWFYEGDKLEREVAFGVPVPLEDVERIGVYFQLAESNGQPNSATNYQWNFIVNEYEEGAGEETATYTPATEEDAAAAMESAEENLSAVKPGNIIPADKASIDTSTGIVLEDSDIVREFTSSAIAIKQKLDNEGDAAVLGSDIVFQVRSKSFDGYPLPDPKADETDGLPLNYKVLKSFEKGGSIDLLSKFRSLFSYDGDTKTVKLNATLVIIDGPYTGDPEDPDDDEPGVEPAFDGSKYGVKLSGDGKFLFIYDGVKNGIASDPIALVADEGNNQPPAASSGCDAGLGVAGLFVAAGAALIALKKRG